ncbi:MAG: NTP transferase domain-containing protein [Myxococcota bacterium]
MKAIILSAGQGTRLGRLTADRPKCLLPVRGETSLLRVQLDVLAACGVDDVRVVTGFGAELVDAELRTRHMPSQKVGTLFNPFFDCSDNLISCFMARFAMDEPFLLINGDTVFETRALERLLASPPASLTLAVNEKDSYDADDMKVSLDGTRLRAVGKHLPLDTVDAESIGLMFFRDRGPARFRRALELSVREPCARKAWYLSVVDAMARTDRVETVAITGLRWWEVDCREDLVAVRHGLAASLRGGAAARVLELTSHARRQRSGRNQRCASGY